MNKYDIHTHILPAIDDGSQDIDISVVLLEELESQGVTHLALTPHFYTQYSPVTNHAVKEFVAKRQNAYNLVKSEYSGSIRLILGCELHLTQNLMCLEDITPFCYENGRYMLTEMPYNCTFKSDDIKLLESVINKYGVTPILAHIERYPVLLKDQQLLEKLISMGCMAQVNTESLCKMFVGQKLIKYLNSGLVQFIGTDTHSTVRGCDFAKGYKVISKKCTPNVIENLSNYGKKLFGL
ncbi:MAG: hypothetical protein MRZ25_04970 [Ruminococcus sp.]|nr:hypothetical protein [Ruminococcus sp.]